MDILQDELSRERRVLQKEYQWVLNEEVKTVIQDIQGIITETKKNFTSAFTTENETRAKAERFLLSSANATPQAKCMVTLLGDLIYEADLALKLQKQQMVPHQSRIYPEVPWKLQQVQDAGNHLQVVLSCIDDWNESVKVTSGQQVINLLDSMIDGVRWARDSLMLPRRRTLEELVKNSALKSFKPALPTDAVVSFFIQSHKLVLAVYQLCTNQSNKVDIVARYQLEASVPWLNHVLMLMTIILQKCQQLKDKVTMFMQYESELKQTTLSTTRLRGQEGGGGGVDGVFTTDLINCAADNECKKKKTNNPFLDCPDNDDDDDSCRDSSKASCRVKHDLFADLSDSSQQVTWM
jgi:hypothetical protein